MNRKQSATLQAVLLFYIFANPMLYRFTDSLLGNTVGRLSSYSGCPTNLGLIVHAIAFGAVVWSLM